MGWNFGDILDAISPVLPPDAPAFLHGDRTITWSEATKASNNLARGLIASLQVMVRSPCRKAGASGGSTGEMASRMSPKFQPTRSVP